MTTETLSKLFKENSITPPSKKDEDWLTYDLDKLLKLELNKNSNQESSIDISSEYYLYILNGKLFKKNLPDTIKLTNESIQHIESNNAFIKLATLTNNSIHIDLTSTQNESITIYYETTESNLSNSSINITHNGKNPININRIFKAHKGSISNTHTNLSIGDKSELTISDTNRNNEGDILDFIDASLKKESKFNNLNQTYLSNHSRFQNRVFIKGTESNATLHGLAINDIKQKCYFNTHIFHDAENCESNQLFKSLVKENGTLEYNGKVSVLPNAQQTNSYQLNQNIVLDKYANIYSRPQLFIDADDVKCTHGSTTGDINKHEVLYLMSRGIDELSSRKMVLNAFIEEIFNHDKFKEHKQSQQRILDRLL